MIQLPLDPEPQHMLIVTQWQAKLHTHRPLGSSKANHKVQKVVAVVDQSLSCVCLFATPWTVARRAPLSMDFPGKNTGVDCHFLLQGIFPTQGSNLLWSPCLAGISFTTEATEKRSHQIKPGLFLFHVSFSLSVSY